MDWTDRPPVIWIRLLSHQRGSMELSLDGRANGLIRGLGNWWIRSEYKLSTQIVINTVDSYQGLVVIKGRYPVTFH